MPTSADERAATDEAEQARQRVVWALLAKARANRAAGHLLRAQGFSIDAKRRAADARRAAEARRSLERPG